MDTSRNISPPLRALNQTRRRVLADLKPDASVPRLLVGTGSCGAAVGARHVVQALRDAAQATGAVVHVLESGCTGMCYEAVQVTLQRTGHPDLSWSRVTPDQAGQIVELATQARPMSDIPPSLVWQPESLDGIPGFRDTPFLASQNRILFDHTGCIDPTSLHDALESGAYLGLATALSRSPDEVLPEITASGLAGRGGAYFPVGRKLAGCRRMPGPERYLIVNAEEGEPGVFKDRHLLEGDPHRVIEGALIAAYAMGASRILIYLNGQAAVSLTRLSAALSELRKYDLIGNAILGSDFSCDAEVRIGAGGYVLGEETSLLESIEGSRSMPRVRPPFPFESGLWRRPSAIQNVESLANLPIIMNHGAQWFQQLGTPTGTGTKLICVSGAVRRPGVVEVEIGTTLRTLLYDIGGGVPDDRHLQAVLTGGPSGFLVPPAMLDIPLEPRLPDILLGSGNVVAIDESQSVLDLVRQLTRFNARESCGKCTPCREGVNQLAAILDRVAAENPRPTDREDIDLLCDVAASASLCGLGQMAPNPIRSLLRHFVVPDLQSDSRKVTSDANP